jgi:hypothetical protein
MRNSMRKLKKALFASVALALISSPAWTVLSQSTQSGSMRDPFVLELPDIGNVSITAPEAVIPTPEIHTIRLLVRRPFSDSINYGKIHTFINGESAGTIQNTRAGRDGYIVTCDIDSKPHLFRFRPGKNVVEISATDRNNRSYYASYVLLAGGKGAGDSSSQGAMIENIALSQGSDRQPPTVYLIEPKTAVQMTGATATARVRGVVSDDSGSVASITINGQPAPLSLATGTRGLVVRPTASTVSGEMAFDRTMTISGDSSSVVVEAKDQAGNVTRVLIPVRRREAAVSSRFSGRKFALVIGVSRYNYHEGGLNNLVYADADARSMRDFLQRREGGGFSPSDILYLENEQATIEGVRAALKSFLPKAGPNDLIFIFIAGHGAPDPYAPQNLYFLMHDTKVANMPGTALPMDELKEMLEHGVRAERVLVFVDTCHSAGLSGEKLVQTRGLENNLTNLYAQKLYKEAGRAILTSSDVSEVSQESDQWGGGHGIFTLALLDGFRGGADANGDRLITAGELFNYVRDRVRVETAFRQNPRALPGLSADLTLAVVPAK